MKRSPEITEFWQRFCRENTNVDENSPYQVWYFGDTPELADELAQLVLAGKKRATASIEYEYRDKPDEAPILDRYSVVTDFSGHPKCVVRTTEIRRIPYNEVDAEFAFDEGEGDQSLDYWRGVHWDYFSRQCIELGIQPSETMPVICERFELLYPTSKE
ncbi:MAG TPA: ASCH domain-containing protein [Pyrinomonadaceae bacterium]|nr:ASCH domain-containing protein [Pyrinomonadaceae bacterium]